MFKKLTIGEGFVIAMMAVITITLLSANIMYGTYYNRATNDIVANSSREINKQVIMNYERYIDEVIGTANYLERRTIELTEDDDMSSLQSLFQQAAEMSEDMVAAVLIRPDGHVLISSDTRVPATGLNTRPWYVNATRDKEIFHFSAPHDQDVFAEGAAEVITVTKSINYYQGPTLKQGVLMIDLTTQNLIGLAQKTNLGENGHILILNETSEFVYASNESCNDATCESKTIVDDIILGGRSVLLNDDYMYVNINTLKHTRWRIATFINVSTVYASRQELSYVQYAIFASALFISLMLGIIMSNSISKPLKKLKSHMSKVESGDLVKEVEVTGQKEIIALAGTFNHMIIDIRRLMERLVSEQKEKRKSEFLALQTQINPHFLYNTLDSIVWLAENHRNDEVIEMVIALSHFFRISISRGKNIISVKDELTHAGHYLNIQKIRYNLKFDYAFEIDPNVYEYSVVKLILQPIIENAIHHGISSEYETGEILIKAYTVEDHLVFEIENNGYGIIEEDIKAIYDNMKQENKATGFGLRNVYQRLKLYYGDDADVVITSVVDEMTNVKLIVPLKREVNHEETV
ncbi:MAG: sensor histidine kinase [Acholeplasmataceae bacterium]|nr:sensor histidine kinase [Acholeplasmataceae bacterium]